MPVTVLRTAAKKSRNIQCLLTEDEYAKLLAIAEADGAESLSYYLRSMVRQLIASRPSPGGSS